MPFNLWSAIEQRITNQRNVQAAAQRAEQQRIGAQGAQLGQCSTRGQRVHLSGFQNTGFNGERTIEQISISETGNFTSWIRGLEMESEIRRFDFFICHKRNAPDKLEFRRKVGILNWMEVVKDYKE